MTYWHMQLHPDNPEQKNEIDILEKTSLIGLGDLKGPQVDDFIEIMDVGDIVLVRRRRIPLALVEVVGEHQYESKPNKKLDWFEHRRKVKVLEISKIKKHDFSQPRGTLRKSINKKAITYKYINDWYNRLEPSLNQTKNQRIRGLYIQNYKMFVDFKLSFLNKNQEVLPLIVLAGINGSGKTTLLEYIDRFDTQKSFKDNDYLEIEGNTFKNGFFPDMPLKIFRSSGRSKGKTGIIELRKNIRYFPVTVNFTKDTQELIVSYSNRLIKKSDYRPSEAYEAIRDILDDIFHSMDLNVSFSRLDEQDNVFFMNREGQEFSIDELSTGEKTLLSKIFHLYIGDYAGKIILVDEPELSLHPSWQGKILGIYEKFCQSQNSQMVIATHSPQIIGSAKREYLRILSMKNGKIGVVEDLPSYGRDINWVLKNVMGVDSVRNLEIAEKIQECQELLKDEKYDECEEALNAIEKDPEVLKLRNILFFEQE